MKKQILSALIALSFVSAPVLAEESEVMYLENVGVWEHYSVKDDAVGNGDSFVVRIDDDFNVSYFAYGIFTGISLEDKRGECKNVPDDGKVMVKIDGIPYKGVMETGEIEGYPVCYTLLTGDRSKTMFTNLYNGKEVTMDSVKIPSANLKELVDAVSK